MKRCYLLPVFLSKIFNNLPEGCIIQIHIGNIEHSGKSEFLTQIPCFLCTYFNTRLTGYNDYRSSGSRTCFFCFAHKIKHSRSIHEIDLCPFPLKRYNAGCKRDLSLLLFLGEIRNGTSVLDAAHTIGKSCKISHGLSQ
ncbi:MAG: hypothetical protein BWY61_01342 [Firmicutes bacterium ADurb.Bin354]|nr:MAG: hypothetical protein BWY61_01342 [Firmicutes bacterium ADurb.Bin354]